MITKKQHIVPEGYLKNFINERGKVYTYNFMYNQFEKKEIRDTCFHNYAYEESKKNIDNALEKELWKIENTAIPHIDSILKKLKNGTLVQDNLNHELLYKYMILQYIRSDSGRILFERAINGLNSLDHHMVLNELRQNEEYKLGFNKRFKENGKLKKHLNFLYLRDKCKIRVGRTQKQKFITSDNPVALFSLPYVDNTDMLKMIMPISPNACLYCFINDKYYFYQEAQMPFPYEVHDETVLGYNQAIINVANYWIISQDPINVFTRWNIYNRKTR